jgi:chromosome segregation ATPase
MRTDHSSIFIKLLLTISRQRIQDKHMADEAQTKPMLETILERIDMLDEKFSKRFDALEQRFEAVESLVDRAASAAYDTRAEVRELKADVKRLREQLNVPA